jgi:surface protein
VSASNQVKLPLESSGTYDFLVDWGDGNQDTITVWNQAETTHTYSVSGDYVVTITGTINGWRFNFGGDDLKLLDISQCGPLQLGNNDFYFAGCSNMTWTATDPLNLSSTTSLFNIFRDCSAFNGAIGNWDVSGVTVMNEAFRGCTVFNQPIGNWNVSSVTDMGLMFDGCNAFNQNINSWDTSSVTNMLLTFSNCQSFDQPLASWDVSIVTNMIGMFEGALVFNQPLDDWDVSSCTNMISMFRNSQDFDQPLSSWDVSSVTNMAGMFEFAFPFNQDLSAWDISLVTSMSNMFNGLTLSTSNYSSILIGWDANSHQNNVPLNAGSSKYSAGAATTARSNLVGDGWTITDGGQA